MVGGGHPRQTGHDEQQCRRGEMRWDTHGMMNYLVGTKNAECLKGEQTWAAG